MSFLSLEIPHCLLFVYFSSTFVFRIPSTFDLVVILDKLNQEFPEITDKAFKIILLRAHEFHPGSLIGSTQIQKRPMHSAASGGHQFSNRLMCSLCLYAPEPQK